MGFRMVFDESGQRMTPFYKRNCTLAIRYRCYLVIDGMF